MNDAKKLEYFLKPSMGRMIVSILTIFFFSAVLIGALILVPFEEYSISFCAGILLFVGIIIAEAKKIKGYINMIKSVNAEIEELNKNGLFPLVTEEFKNADLFCKGTLRLSDHYVFGKQLGRVLEYRNITRVFQYVYNNRQREIHVMTTTGETVKLDKLKLRNDQEAQEIMDRMHMINSQIKIRFDE